MTTINIALLLVAVSIAILIAAIVYNSKSKETLRQAKDINKDALVSIKEAERQRDASLDNYRKEHIEHSMTQINLSEAQMEVQTLKDNLHALGEEIINPAIPPTFRIEENDELFRVVADYTSLSVGKTIPLAVRDFAKGDDFVLAGCKANKLLSTLTK